MDAISEGSKNSAASPATSGSEETRATAIGTPAAIANARWQRRFTELLLDRGVMKAHEKFFVSTAHTDDDVETTLAAFTSAAEALRREQSDA